ncbi:LytTR family DNA-binding domain-containing protein [Accumulibacter sp.]|uniref:LytR/AlgR family response regulator transcription factor n=1 Tax=Accumulibacter sp. TaxID=2053492 RepID=UPI0025EE56E9|nr:LytTR family DNA-binding domain-containing protein [Accumulibacter sp.]MCM8611736.1 LytTR family DNA-binding domain-containing protein [Accumulibacter sp.]MCM8635606.1 LytTR family DNA-binding domain-containing protein [Accumulibacter sp.]MCM8639205.1 LytTR family DNA-binding domain-containing protein [Accumulibacter sp.]
MSAVVSPLASPIAVLIVDDEAPARARLRDVLADIATDLPNEVVAEAENGVVALGVIAAQKVDVALVDIRMPTMDGVEFASHLSQVEDPPAVIFVTAYDAYAVQAFELSALDYLLKPVRSTRLLAALRKLPPQPAPLSKAQLARLPQAARSHLACHERGRLLLIPVAAIIYLKADLKYVTARTREREFLVDESLTHLEEEYGDQFVRLHRSVLVARDAIIGFARSGADDADTQWQAMLRDVPERLPVSRRQWPLVKSLVRRSGV